MKKLLLSLSVLFTLGAFAQPDMEITLTSPSSGDMITAGTAWNFDVTITNVGNASHLGEAGGDTIIYFPLFNGQLLPTSGGGAVAWYGNANALAANGSFTESQMLNISGGSSGPIEICAGTLVFGTSYTTDNRDTSDACANVTYTNSMNLRELRLTETFDNSFYSNGMYYARVSSKNNLVNPRIEFVDISGRVVLTQEVASNGGEASEDIDLKMLPTGIFIVKLYTEEGLISINKMMK